MPNYRQASRYHSVLIYFLLICCNFLSKREWNELCNFVAKFSGEVKIFILKKKPRLSSYLAGGPNVNEAKKVVFINRWAFLVAKHVVIQATAKKISSRQIRDKGTK